MPSTKPEPQWEAEQALARYVVAVADAVGVQRKVALWEVAEEATAYLPLPGRGCDDLMLVWNARTGWSVAVEPQSCGQAVVLARLGDPVVPEPRQVAEFVTAAVDGSWTETGRRPCTGVTDGDLVSLVRAYAS